MLAIEFSGNEWSVLAKSRKSLDKMKTLSFGVFFVYLLNVNESYRSVC